VRFTKFCSAVLAPTAASSHLRDPGKELVKAFPRGMVRIDPEAAPNTLATQKTQNSVMIVHPPWGLADCGPVRAWE